MSLAELLSQARMIKVFPDECSACFCLNRDGNIARAAEPIFEIRPCLCRRFVYSADDEAMICAKCWTPKKRGLQ